MLSAKILVPMLLAGTVCSPLTARAIGSHQAGQVVGHSVSVSSEDATVVFELEDGTELRIEFKDGALYVNGEPTATYVPGGEFERAFRRLLSRAAELNSAEFLLAFQEWRPEGLRESDATARERVSSRLAALAAAEADFQLAQTRESVTAVQQRDSAVVIDLSAAVEGALAGVVAQLGGLEHLDAQLLRLRQEIGDIDVHIGELHDVELDVRGSRVHIGDITIPRGEVVDGSLVVLRGDASVYGHVQGHILALDGSVRLHRGARVDGDVVAVNGRVLRAGATVAGEVRTIMSPEALQRRERFETRRAVSGADQIGRNIATLLGMFVAMASIGFGLTFFLPNQLEAVSDTVSESFGRSFLTGLLAQPLALPLFVMLIVGLAVTVIGTLLIPLAALGFAAALMASVVGGYLAVAKSIGEIYRRRKVALGTPMFEVSQYRILLYGLSVLLVIWVPAVLLGWIPVAGEIFALVAAIFTWIMATAGLGAALISRGGVRAFFPRRFRPELSREYGWKETTGPYGTERTLPGRDRE